MDPEMMKKKKKKAINFRDLQFKYKENQYPEVVDYVGQKKQIDFAKELGVKHVVRMLVCVSSLWNIMYLFVRFASIVMAME